MKIPFFLILIIIFFSVNANCSSFQTDDHIEHTHIEISRTHSSLFHDAGSLKFDAARKIYYYGKSFSEVDHLQSAPIPSVINEKMALYVFEDVKSSFVPPFSSLRFLISLNEGEKIQTARDYPNCVHGKLFMEYEGPLEVGSGVLISEDCVLTAAHNIQNPDYKGRIPKRVIFYPGLDGTDPPAWTGMAAAVAIHPDWYHSIRSGNPKRGADLAIIKLKTRLSLGHIELAVFNKNLSSASKVNLTGYPAQSEREMYQMQGDLTSTSQEEGLLIYSMKTHNGQSGSAVWIDHPTKRQCIGIHTTWRQGDPSFGTLINEEKMNKINYWMNYLLNFKLEEGLGRLRIETNEELPPPLSNNGQSIEDRKIDCKAYPWRTHGFIELCQENNSRKSLGIGVLVGEKTVLTARLVEDIVLKFKYNSVRLLFRLLSSSEEACCLEVTPVCHSSVEYLTLIKIDKPLGRKHGRLDYAILDDEKLKKLITFAAYTKELAFIQMDIKINASDQSELIVYRLDLSKTDIFHGTNLLYYNNQESEYLCIAVHICEENSKKDSMSGVKITKDLFNSIKRIFEQQTSIRS